jgi:hypothetical protein
MSDHEAEFDGGGDDDGADESLTADGGLVAALRRLGRDRPPVADFGVRAGAPRAVQLDLNDENNLGDLEDPGLVEHMRRARETLAEHDRVRADAPGTAALDAQDSEARRALSLTTTGLSSGGMALRCACDDVLVQAANLGRLIIGVTPHGFPADNRALPPDGALARNLAHMAKKLNEAGGTLETLVTNLQGLERDLALARRAYETVVDGLRRRCANPAPGAGACEKGRDDPPGSKGRDARN